MYIFKIQGVAAGSPTRDIQEYGVDMQEICDDMDKIN